MWHVFRSGDLRVSATKANRDQSVSMHLPSCTRRARITVAFEKGSVQIPTWFGVFQQAGEWGELGELGELGESEGAHEGVRDLLAHRC